MSEAFQKTELTVASWGGSWPHVAALAGSGGHIALGRVAPVESLRTGVPVNELPGAEFVMGRGKAPRRGKR